MRPATEAERALVAEQAHFPITEEHLVFVSDITEGEGRKDQLLANADDADSPQP